MRDDGAPCRVRECHAGTCRAGVCVDAPVLDGTVCRDAANCQGPATCREGVCVPPPERPLPGSLVQGGYWHAEAGAHRGAGRFTVQSGGYSWSQFDTFSAGDDAARMGATSYDASTFGQGLTLQERSLFFSPGGDWLTVVDPAQLLAQGTQWVGTLLGLSLEGRDVSFKLSEPASLGGDRVLFAAESSKGGTWLLALDVSAEGVSLAWREQLPGFARGSPIADAQGNAYLLLTPPGASRTGPGTLRSVDRSGALRWQQDATTAPVAVAGEALVLEGGEVLAPETGALRFVLREPDGTRAAPTAGTFIDTASGRITRAVPGRLERFDLGNGLLRRRIPVPGPAVSEGVLLEGGGWAQVRTARFDAHINDWYGYESGRADACVDVVTPDGELLSYDLPVSDDSFYYCYVKAASFTDGTVLLEWNAGADFVNLWRFSVPGLVPLRSGWSSVHGNTAWQRAPAEVEPGMP
ncbi:hypothetical protein FGE12_24770 [Aggregicoccus sp. 17bor-14]|uniref:hypothetical protein n=1 Tax=Myxococcaceae TaxID=31 RepID=UPI00129D1126|nr:MULTISPECIES: hypothetical protein [Myxococcaceae]MBF5045643.1 hypothetical protein [Simulacricoccus sp. 17bor-14]MRI91380.1 hypothetical protein [Aggregicoccus sp. 17bor-14]